MAKVSKKNGGETTAAAAKKKAGGGKKERKKKTDPAVGGVKMTAKRGKAKKTTSKEESTAKSSPKKKKILPRKAAKAADSKPAAKSDDKKKKKAGDKVIVKKSKEPPGGKKVKQRPKATATAEVVGKRGKDAEMKGKVVAKKKKRKIDKGILARRKLERMKKQGFLTPPPRRSAALNASAITNCMLDSGIQFAKIKTEPPDPDDEIADFATIFPPPEFILPSTSLPALNPASKQPSSASTSSGQATAAPGGGKRSVSASNKRSASSEKPSTAKRSHSSSSQPQQPPKKLAASKKPPKAAAPSAKTEAPTVAKSNKKPEKSKKTVSAVVKSKKKNVVKTRKSRLRSSRDDESVSDEEPEDERPDSDLDRSPPKARKAVRKLGLSRSKRKLRKRSSNLQSEMKDFIVGRRMASMNASAMMTATYGQKWTRKDPMKMAIEASLRDMKPVKLEEPDILEDVEEADLDLEDEEMEDEVEDEADVSLQDDEEDEEEQPPVLEAIVDDDSRQSQGAKNSSSATKQPEEIPVLQPQQSAAAVRPPMPPPTPVPASLIFPSAVAGLSLETEQALDMIVAGCIKKFSRKSTDRKSTERKEKSAKLGDVDTVGKAVEDEKEAVKEDVKISEDVEMDEQESQRQKLIDSVVLKNRFRKSSGSNRKTTLSTKKSSLHPEKTTDSRKLCKSMSSSSDNEEKEKKTTGTLEGGEKKMTSDSEQTPSPTKTLIAPWKTGNNQNRLNLTSVLAASGGLTSVGHRKDLASSMAGGQRPADVGSKQHQTVKKYSEKPSKKGMSHPPLTSTPKPASSPATVGGGFPHSLPGSPVRMLSSALPGGGATGLVMGTSSGGGQQPPVVLGGQPGGSNSSQQVVLGGQQPPGTGPSSSQVLGGVAAAAGQQPPTATVPPTMLPTNQQPAQVKAPALVGTISPVKQTVSSLTPQSYSQIYTTGAGSIPSTVYSYVQTPVPSTVYNGAYVQAVQPQQNQFYQGTTGGTSTGQYGTQFGGSYYGGAGTAYSPQQGGVVGSGNKGGADVTAAAGSAAQRGADQSGGVGAGNGGEWFPTSSYYIATPTGNMSFPPGAVVAAGAGSQYGYPTPQGAATVVAVTSGSQYTAAGYHQSGAPPGTRIVGPIIALAGGLPVAPGGLPSVPGSAAGGSPQQSVSAAAVTAVSSGSCDVRKQQQSGQQYVSSGKPVLRPSIDGSSKPQGKAAPIMADPGTIKSLSSSSITSISSTNNKAVVPGAQSVYSVTSLPAAAVMSPDYNTGAGASINSKGQFGSQTAADLSSGNSSSGSKTAAVVDSSLKQLQDVDKSKQQQTTTTSYRQIRPKEAGTAGGKREDGGGGGGSLVSGRPLQIVGPIPGAGTSLSGNNSLHGSQPLSATSVPGQLTAGSSVPGQMSVGSSIPGQMSAGTPIPGQMSAGTPIPGQMTPLPGQMTPLPGQMPPCTPLPGQPSLLSAGSSLASQPFAGAIIQPGTGALTSGSSGGLVAAVLPQPHVPQQPLGQPPQVPAVLPHVHQQQPLRNSHHTSHHLHNHQPLNIPTITPSLRLASASSGGLNGRPPTTSSGSEVVKQPPTMVGQISIQRKTATHHDRSSATDSVKPPGSGQLPPTATITKTSDKSTQHFQSTGAKSGSGSGQRQPSRTVMAAGMRIPSLEADRQRLLARNNVTIIPKHASQWKQRELFPSARPWGSPATASSHSTTSEKSRPGQHQLSAGLSSRTTTVPEVVTLDDSPTNSEEDTDSEKPCEPLSLSSAIQQSASASLQSASASLQSAPTSLQSAKPVLVSQGHPGLPNGLFRVAATSAVQTTKSPTKVTNSKETKVSSPVGLKRPLFPTSTSSSTVTSDVSRQLTDERQRLAASSPQRSTAAPSSPKQAKLVAASPPVLSPQVPVRARQQNARISSSMARSAANALVHSDLGQHKKPVSEDLDLEENMGRSRLQLKPATSPKLMVDIYPVLQGKVKEEKVVSKCLSSPNLSTGVEKVKQEKSSVSAADQHHQQQLQQHQRRKQQRGEAKRHSSGQLISHGASAASAACGLVPWSKRSKEPPKNCGGWAWVGDGSPGKVYLHNLEHPVERICYEKMRHEEGDEEVQVRDCILLASGSRKKDLPFIAKVTALWENPEDGEMMMSVLWYYRPEHVEGGRTTEDLPEELFASKHRDHTSVACIEDKCYVMTFNEFCRYKKFCRGQEYGVNPAVASSDIVPKIQPPGYPRSRLLPACQVPADRVFLCRKVYDSRCRRMLKNPC